LYEQNLIDPFQVSEFGESDMLCYSKKHGSIKGVALLILITTLLIGCARVETTAASSTQTDTQIPATFTSSPVPPTFTAIPTSTQIPNTTIPTPQPTTTSTPEPTIPAFTVMGGIEYANDDPVQSLSIYLPQEENKKPQTLLVFGGEGFPKLVKHFAKTGYPVIAFKARNDSYLTETQDGFCALAWAHANASVYGFDAGQIIPVGGSMWGGNAALLGLVDDPSPFLEECPYTLPETGRVLGVITLAGVFNYSQEKDFFSGFIQAITDYMGGTPDQVPGNWAEASAITWVRGDEPPFLLVHGTSDTNVSQRQSENFAEALENVGSDSELVLLPGINHSNSVTAPQVFEAMQAFLEQLILEQSAISQENDQPATPSAGVIDDLRITIIYDNYLQDERLPSEWGFAALVEYQDYVLLFDTGGTDTLMENMHVLDIDPRRIQAVVLSHAHGDHIGGLYSFLAEANQPPVYLLPSFPNDFKDNVADLTEVIEVSDPTEIFPNIFSTGQVSGEVKEQGLAIRTNQGTVIITGCAHPGITRMVRRGRSAVQPGSDVDYDPIALVIGGFHLISSSPGQIEGIIADLESLNVQQISPTHCTGDAAIAMFEEAFNEGFIAGGAGKVITLGGSSP
jgi:7,8-dihydropterin-6-yl-methyl-4-(beta-D-ribofuranosyl)aminobenzene 5'-phosphate synthase